MHHRSLVLPTALLLASPLLAQSWQRLDNNGPTSGSVPLLLTDGTVLVHSASSRNWKKLTPDAFGSYLHGTWSSIAPMPVGYEPLYFASAVLADGRVVVIGGEYNNGAAVWTNKGAIYEPRTDTWANLPAPAGWNSVGDGQCAVLPDGRFFLANALDRRTAALDPLTLTWFAFGNAGKNGSNNEENWTLLPDGTVLTVDIASRPLSERFLPSQGSWIDAAAVPVSLVDNGSSELGPGVLRPDGTVFWTGGTGHTAIYTPPVNLNDPGSWTVGPDFPLYNGRQLTIADGPACLLPNGKVLCLASPEVFQSPSRFFEFDGTNLVQVPHPARAESISSFQGTLLLLPSGQVLFTSQHSSVYLYNPSGGPDNAWRPTITSYPTSITPGETYVLTGTLFNGLSQGGMYGDDAAMATNYPLVRLTNTHSGHVFYARTFDHSTMAVATGALPTSTHVHIPRHLEPGAYLLEVVVNGIASAPVPIARLAHTLPGPGTPSVTVDY